METLEPNSDIRPDLALHAVWSVSERCLCLWAERLDPTGKARRGSGIRSHPFAASAEFLDPLPDLQGESGEIVLFLPSTEIAPLPSPAVIAHTGTEPPAGESVSLRTWRVPCLRFTGEAATTRLMQPPAPHEGEDFRFWREAARFALDLLRRERFLPALERDLEGRSRTAWLPALVICNALETFDVHDLHRPVARSPARGEVHLAR